MRKLYLGGLLASAVALGFCAAPAAGQPGSAPPHKDEVGFAELDGGISVRRRVVGPRKTKGVVLLLHGFPETLRAWDGVAGSLARDYEVHAFDWPGFGLSSRPPASTFGYTPRDYAQVLKAYIARSRIGGTKLVIYATDIGALPALLLALEEPGLARRIIVGDFAPFDRPKFMYQSLQALKSPSTSEQTRQYMNRNRDEILANSLWRGLADWERFRISDAFREDMARGWDHGGLSSADAFYHYYSGFTRDQNYLEAHMRRLKTPLKVVWGEKDLYIEKAMGVEFARRAGAELTLLPNVGHYPHLQDARHVVEEIRAAFR